ncbi:threonine/serine dehydratase [Virgibacillus siamensis]|uniref:threonine/serine dehydratase n=1 Tax=Virgibacillus siamensis TaxID=480071 RepID=UPI000987267D|nr:threonine/serine dehydratase [Virgibacillus siamensis]
MIGLKQIYQARETISDIVKQTPIMTSETLSINTGNKVFLKGEHLQKTGSFKIRGATNKVKDVAQQNPKSIVAASSGNHGQAVAYIANKLGIPSTIVVPEDAASNKQKAIQAYNGNLEFCGVTSAERIERAKEICEGGDGIYIPPYDDPLIMAGQGTIGMEILEQVDNIDEVYVPVGGGGLISGVLTAIKEMKPSIRVIGVEPALANDTYLSLQSGERVTIDATSTIADGLRTTIPGELTFPAVQRYVDDLQLVEEDAIRKAFDFILTRMKQVIEPSAAVSVAAALARPAEGKRIVVLVSGGNMDGKVIHSLLK